MPRDKDGCIRALVASVVVDVDVVVVVVVWLVACFLAACLQTIWMTFKA